MSNYESIYRDPYAALTGGNLDQQIAVSTGVANNIDFRDSNAVNNEALKATFGLLNNFQDSNISPILIGAAGTSGMTVMAQQEIVSRGGNPYTFIKDGNKIGDSLDYYANIATNNYKNDKNQTQMELQNVTLENLMNELSVINEWMGNWAKVLESAISGVGTLITAYLATHMLKDSSIGKMLGVSSSGGKHAASGSGVVGSLLSTLGPALGVGATVLGVGAVVNGIYDRIVNGDNDNASEGNEAYREAKKQGKSEQEAIAAQAQSWMSTATTKHETTSGYLRQGITDNPNDVIGNIARGTGLVFTGSASGIGQWVSTWGKKGTELSAQNFKNFNDALDSKGIHDENERQQQILSWLLLAYAATQDESNLKAVGVSKSMLAQYLKGMKKQEFLNKFENAEMSGKFYAPQTPEGKAYTKFTDGDMKWLMSEFNIHRQGLDRVPYDNYPSLLHQDETVLNATTADELRNLVQVYRETSKQSVDFDAIISNQTTIVCSKLDEVISYIRSTPSYTTSTATNKIERSMRSIKSIYSFE